MKTFSDILIFKANYDKFLFYIFGEDLFSLFFSAVYILSGRVLRQKYDKMNTFF